MMNRIFAFVVNMSFKEGARVVIEEKLYEIFRILHDWVCEHIMATRIYNFKLRAKLDELLQVRSHLFNLEQVVSHQIDHHWALVVLFIPGLLRVPVVHISAFICQQLKQVLARIQGRINRDQFFESTATALHQQRQRWVSHAVDSVDLYALIQ